MSAWIKNPVCILFAVLTGPAFAFISAQPVTYQLMNMTGSALVVESAEGMLTTYAVPEKDFDKWIKEDKWDLPKAILKNDGNFDATHYEKEIKDKSGFKNIALAESMTALPTKLGQIKYAWHSGGYVFVTYIEFKMSNPKDPLDTHDCKARIIMKAADLKSWTYGMELGAGNASVKTNSTKNYTKVAGVTYPRTTSCDIGVNYGNPTTQFPIDSVTITLVHDHKL